LERLAVGTVFLGDEDLIYVNVKLQTKKQILPVYSKRNRDGSPGGESYLSQTQSTAVTAVAARGVGLAFAPAAGAEAGAALVNARSPLWSMIDAKNKPAQEAFNAKVQASSTQA
jgi:hypothetical protein